MGEGVKDFDPFKVVEEMSRLTTKETVFDEGLCLIPDVIDGDKMLFPQAAVETAILRFAGSPLHQAYVTMDYGKSISDILGWPMKVELRDSGLWVLCHLLEKGEKLRKAGAEYAIGGLIHRAHVVEDKDSPLCGIRVIDEFELRGFALTNKRTVLDTGQLEKVHAVTLKL